MQSRQFILLERCIEDDYGDYTADILMVTAGEINGLSAETHGCGSTESPV
jgi:hypothetical protein